MSQRALKRKINDFIALRDELLELVEKYDAVIADMKKCGASQSTLLQLTISRDITEAETKSLLEVAKALATTVRDPNYRRNTWRWERR